MALLILCFLAGIFARKTERLPEQTPAVLNAFIINLSLPALAFLFMHEMEFSTKLIYPVIMPWICFSIAFVFFKILQKIMNLSNGTTGCLILVGGLGNTSFVGLPMITAFYGAEYVGIGVLCDQPGSFLVLSTLGILVASTHSELSASASGVAKKIITFPPFQAVIIGLLFRSFPLTEWMIVMLKGLGATLTPLALVSVGFQLKFTRSNNIIKVLTTGLIFKLILAPTVIYFIYVMVLQASGMEVRVTIFEAAMGPMITAGIIAMQYNLDNRLATMMMGIGIPISFITLPMWHYLLSGV